MRLAEKAHAVWCETVGCGCVKVAEALRESMEHTSTLHIRSGANPPEHDADHCREATVSEVVGWLSEQGGEVR